MSAWTENEDGPDCRCGGPAVVKRLPAGGWVLMCFAHTPEAGLIMNLPPQRPGGWPDDSEYSFMRSVPGLP